MALTDISGKLDYENTTKFTMRKCSRIQKKKESACLVCLTILLPISGFIRLWLSYFYFLGFVESFLLQLYSLTYFQTFLRHIKGFSSLFLGTKKNTIL